MSLRVWLPLNGDLHNQGLDGNVSFYKNTGAIINNNGKIGKCYYLDGVDDWLRFNIEKTQYGGYPLSFSVWVKCDTSRTSGNIIDLAADLVLAYTYNSANNTVKFRYWRAYKNSSDTRVGDSNVTTIEYPANKWYHVVSIFDKNLNKIYVDGELSQSFDSSSKYTENWQPLLASSHNKLNIGKSSGDSNWGNIYVNDVRIYDHALSLKQIKEISKGLILHYKLDNPIPNLLAETSFNGNSKKFILTSGTEGGFWYTPTENIISSTQYTISCQMRGDANINLYKICTGGNESVHWINRNDLSIVEYKKFSLTFNSPNSNKTMNQVYICTQYGAANSKIGDWFEIKPYSLKLEKGSIATQWYLSKSEINDFSIVYDSSGYQNNGTIIGNIQSINDSPKYAAAASFNGTSAINCASLTPEAKTISLWVKWDAIPSYQSVVFLDYKSKLGLGLMSTGILCGTSGPGSYNTFSKTGLIANTWYHFVVINPGEATGTDRKLYINGVQQEKTSNTSNWAYNVDQIQIGKRSTTSDGLIGKISDVRLYATVLSPEDIKELYQTSALIDRNQNLYVRELVEI